MPTRVFIIGGFLGAGKTTLLLQAARQLTDRGFRVGLVTNDQGMNLVDTALVSAADFPVTEVTGGCFCCNFPDLVGAMKRLQDQVDPDVILAEPVGSCTDLVATTLRPLTAYYPDQFQIAPLTVLIDPQRDLSLFPANVDYLFRKQIAEAEVILLNKCDLFETPTRQIYLDNIASQNPMAKVIAISAQTGEGVADWLEHVLLHPSDSRLTMELDYQRYGDAEAALGWLNVAGQVHSEHPFSILDWTGSLLNKLAEACAVRHVAVAHIKAQGNANDRICKASITGSGLPLTWSLQPPDIASTNLEFILNARVNASPSVLEAIVLNTIESLKPGESSRYYFTHFECFSPKPPNPTYRMASANPN